MLSTHNRKIEEWPMVSAVNTNKTDKESIERYRRREFLPYRYNQLWRIESGMVRTVTWGLDGQVFVLGLWSTGDIIGQYLSGTEECQLECLSSVVVCRLPFSYHCHRGELLSYLRRTKKLLQISQMRSVSDRLNYFLDYFAQQFGIETNDGFLLTVHLTHQDIADVTNSSRVTITRLMGKLHQQGRIGWRREKRKRFLIVRSSVVQTLTHRSMLTTG